MEIVRNFYFLEPLAELNKTVTPVKSAVQMTLKNLDSGPRTRHFRGRLRRNDVEGLLQEGPYSFHSFLTDISRCLFLFNAAHSSAPKAGISI